MVSNTRSITKMYPPKYKEIEKKFEEEYIVADLEEKKRRLSQIREMHRPIEHNDIVKHAKYVD